MTMTMPEIERCLQQLRLCRARLGQAEVVEAQVGRDVRLIVAGKQRCSARDVGPFGEAPAPPLVVLRSGVKLRQVEGDESGFHVGDVDSGRDRSTGQPKKFADTAGFRSQRAKREKQ